MLITNGSTGVIFKDAAQAERVLYRVGQYLRNNYGDLKTRYELRSEDLKHNEDQSKDINDPECQIPMEKHINLNVFVNKFRKNIIDALHHKTDHDKDSIAMLRGNKHASMEDHKDDDAERQAFLEDLDDLIKRLAIYDPKLIPCLGLERPLSRHENFTTDGHLVDSK